MRYLRFAAAWALFAIGHAIWWCFDRKWCGGMHWPIYKIYSFFMLKSERVQGEGAGPWRPEGFARSEQS